MNPGDLMQISDDDGTYVVDIMTGRAMGPKSFPLGTPVIFLGWHEKNYGARESKAQILVEGRVGWVYESELEPIDEAW